MALRRRCLTCSKLTTASRCLECKATRTRHKNSRRDHGTRRQIRRALNLAGGTYCYLCGRWFPADKLELDHVVELIDGGVDHPSNIKAACRPCHKAKTQAARQRRRR